MAAPPPSPLDGNQVLQHAFDDSVGCIRVLAKVQAGGNEIIISHEDDSIRLGNGTDFLTSTTVGGNIGLDVNIINNSIPLVIDGLDTPVIQKVTAVSSATQFSFSVAATTKRLKFKIDGNGKLQYSFTSGTTGTDFYPVAKGKEEELTNLDLSGILTVYFQSDTAGGILRILSWS